MAQVRNIPLKNTVSPNLQIAPVGYSQTYIDQLLNVLRLYFAQIDNFTLGILIPASGITSDRPTDRVRVGTTYFDTTLGIPIWWNGSDWIDATGTVV